jgi:hypothetical protein
VGLFFISKIKRVIITKTKTTKIKIARKTVSKKQTKKKTTKIKDKAKENLDLERDNLLDQLEESEVIYIREKVPIAKKQKTKNIIEIIIPKKYIYLVTKKI